MNYDSLLLTDHAKRILIDAESRSRQMQCAGTNGAHVLLAIPRTPRTFAKLILDELDVNLVHARREVENALRADETGAASTDTIALIVENARLHVKNRRFPFVGSEHILLSIFELGEPCVCSAFERLGVPLQRAIACAERLIDEYG
ncbi:MAG TPA: hypothetical protein DD670_16650 [Planctomycetaceae bacterium]|nr:hypothetical protein [Planctomycetaceae bacterium]